MRKIDNLTGIRGFAALWVVVYHFLSTYHFRGMQIFSWMNPGSIILHGYWGVDIFFVLSGLILALNYAPRFAARGLNRVAFFDFMLKRFFRIYPLHIVTFFAAVAIWAVMASAGHEFHGAAVHAGWTAVCNVLMIHAWGLTAELSWNFPSWSISAEWFAYVLVFPFCVIALAKASAVQCAIVATGLWAGFIYYVFAFHGGDLNLVRTDGVMRIIPEFVGGYATYRLISERQTWFFGDAMMAMGVIGMIALACSPDSFVVLLLPCTALLLAALYTGGGVTDRVFGNRYVVFLGEISYSIYMTHALVLVTTNQILRNFSIRESIPHAVITLLGEVAACVVVGFLAFKLIEAPARTSLLALVSGRGTAKRAINSSHSEAAPVRFAVATDPEED